MKWTPKYDEDDTSFCFANSIVYLKAGTNNSICVSLKSRISVENGIFTKNALFSCFLDIANAKGNIYSNKEGILTVHHHSYQTTFEAVHSNGFVGRNRCSLLRCSENSLFSLTSRTLNSKLLFICLRQLVLGISVSRIAYTIIIGKQTATHKKTASMTYAAFEQI